MFCFGDDFPCLADGAEVHRGWPYPARRFLQVGSNGHQDTLLKHSLKFLFSSSEALGKKEKEKTKLT